MELIRNDSLRFYISQYYEIDMKFILGMEKFDFLDFERNKEMYFKKFSSWQFWQTATPNNYEELKQDDEYRTWLIYTSSHKEFIANLYERQIKVNCTKLINDIVQEVDQLENN